MKRLFWITTIIPVILVLIILFLMATKHLKDPVLDMNIYVSDELLIAMSGALFFGLIAFNSLSQRWLRRVHLENMARAREETAEEHRRFLNRLDHEIKNPLTAIRAGLANLSGTTDPEVQEQILASVDAQTQRLGHLVANLRKIAEVGTRPLEYYPIDLGEIVQEAVAIACENPLAGERRLTVSLPSLPGAGVVIVGDHDLLLLALHNLIGNALKFTYPADVIEVRGTVDAESAVIQVIDTGPGIPLDEQTHVWEELYRGQHAEGVPGSGVGLALVRAIVERHRGSVHLETQPDQGTTITLKLPLAEQKTHRLSSSRALGLNPAVRSRAKARPAG